MDIYTAPSTPPPYPYAPLTHHSFLYAVSRPCSRHRGELNTQIQKIMPKTCRLGFIYPSLPVIIHFRRPSNGHLRSPNMSHTHIYGF